jgi:hypothetical protein
LRTEAAACLAARDAIAFSAAGDSVWKVIYAERTFLSSTLTPGQIRLLPQPIQQMIIAPDFKGRFFFGGF